MRLGPQARKTSMSRLRVLIDGRALIGRFSGVARFITELTRELSNRDDVQPILLCGRQVQDEPALPEDLERVWTSFDRSDRRPSQRCHWEQVHLANIVKESRADVFHATWNSGIPRACPVPSVLTIHDLIAWHEHGESIAGRLRLASHRAAIRSSTQRATAIATVSEFVRQDVLRIMKAAPGRVITIPNGVRIPNELPAVPSNGTPYILYVGGHEPRKNVASLFRVMKLYWMQFGSDLTLHLSGSPDLLCPPARKAYDELADRSPIVWLGQISEQKLREEYAGAAALLMLSLHEGFGLPVLEAMACGCPVIAANRSCLPEVVADGGILVDPDDFSTVATTIRTLIKNEAQRERLIRLGQQRAANFGWEEVAIRYINTYQQVTSPEFGIANARQAGFRFVGSMASAARSRENPC